jgi:hypothetical protein
VKKTFGPKEKTKRCQVDPALLAVLKKDSSNLEATGTDKGKGTRQDCCPYCPDMSPYPGNEKTSLPLQPSLLPL